MRLAYWTVLAAMTAGCKGDKGSQSDAFDGELLGILVVPDEIVVPIGGRLQLKATGLLDGHETVDLTASVSWEADDTNVVEVSERLDSEGELSGLSLGSTQVRARYDDFQSPPVSVHVTDAELQRLSISPDAISLVEGESVQLTANAFFSDGTGGDVTGQVRWVTSDGYVGQLSDGYLTAGGEGSADIHVEWDAAESEPVPLSVLAGAGSASVDLVVSAVQGELAGGVLDLSVTVENTGALSASSFWLDVYVNPDDAPELGDLGTDYIWIEYLGAETSETYDFQIDTSVSTASIYVWADSANYVSESNEDNNVFYGSVSSSSGSGGSGGPDLEVTYFSYVADSESIYYFVDVTNSGDEPADWFYVDLYVDETEQPVVYQEGEAYGYIDELSAGETVYADFILDEYCYYCWSWVQLDTYQSVTETNEANNWAGPIVVESK